LRYSVFLSVSRLGARAEETGGAGPFPMDSSPRPPESGCNGRRNRAPLLRFVPLQRLAVPWSCPERPGFGPSRCDVTRRRATCARDLNENKSLGIGPSLRYFSASRTFPETISGPPIRGGAARGGSCIDASSFSRDVPLSAEHEHLEPGRRRIASGSAPGVRALRSVAPERECRDVSVRVAHVPFAETSTSIDFRRGTGRPLRAMPVHRQAPAGIASAGGTMLVPP
jgi:hypothetical protein